MTDLRNNILKLVEDFADEEHKVEEFIPGKSPVPVSGKVYGAEELMLLVDASLDFWLTTGRFNNEFEEKLATYVGTKYSLTVNSGSSANLLAVSALTSDLLGEKKLRNGDEVITVAAGFPTTVNPILQNGLVPVFIDVDVPTYNIIAEDIESAISDRTRAIVLSHSLGNPFNLDEVKRITEKYDLWLIEDCCDALGSQYHGRMVGTYGDIATVSFYPAHHITTGEGGAVFTNRGKLRKIMESLRDWGRDCWCPPGQSNTCKKRFDWQLGDLPSGYDHKYIYSHLGYNLKLTDMQAAVGLAQLKRINRFHELRKHNFSRLETSLAELEEYLILPKATENSDPSWFGFPITVRDSTPFSRREIVKFLENNHIATRNLFAGNLVKQPYMQGQNFRIAGKLVNTDQIMTNTFWIGVYPGLHDEHIDFVINCFHDFVNKL
jgi:CDP-4-dehydro-6-deoxyglucose reductase, E1